ncbi:InlB B-repeat-containing protein [Streptomyces sp. NBC_00237]|uniref:InlB B-repeat-containing protein n=1 Tax=Streptomyces sp. NBC_00237 TaxID=2975687 RepID=UPI0022596CA7|nr:InlB B-repeat-containing protein [Streptomyces sp. NBC_00237]MCX5205695.1 InlB B-repeat-containing protein [Streptomyces sp. NBC_00237]
MAQNAARPPAVLQHEAVAEDPGILGSRLPESRGRAATSSPNPFLLRSELRKISRKATQQLCVPGGVVRLNLFKDASLKATPSTVEVSDDGTAVSWRGTVASVPGSSVVLDGQNVCGSGAEEPTLSGTVSVPGKLYALEPAGPGQVRAVEYNPGMFEIGEGETRLRSGATGRKTLPVPTPRSHSTARAPRERPGAFASSAAACAAKDYPVIDVMVVWSPKVTSNVGGLKGAEALARQGVGLMNEALANSKVKGRIRLVHTQEMSAYTGGEDDESALSALEKPNDGQLDDINDLRTQYGADLVSMLVTEGSGVGNTPAPPSPRTVNRAFSAVNHTYVANQTMGHEMGHNLGAIHDWVTDDRANMPDRPYNHGYAAPDKAWRTVMAYPAICDGCSRIPYFSNPRVTHPDGQPMGVADGDVNGPVNARPADNARLLGETFSTVADYMTTRTPVELCDVSVSSADAAQGTASTASVGPYAPGTSVTATATPVQGFVFVRWTLDGKPYSTDRRTTVKVAGDHQLVAHFAEGDTPTYRVTTRGDSADGGGVQLSPAGPDFPVGTTVTATFFRWRGSDLPFVGWTLNGASAGNGRQLTFTVDGPTEVVAHFSKVTSTLAASASPDNAGTLDLSSTGPYPPGSTVTVTASPATGKIFSYWLLDGRRVERRSPAGGEETLDVAMGENSRALVAVFSDIHRLGVQVLPDAEAGTATWEPRRAGYATDDTITVTASPKPGYDFTGWQLDGQPAGSDNPYVLTVRSDHQLTALFVKTPVPVVTHRVTAAAAPADAGVVSLVPDKAAYAQDEKVTASVSPKSGYDFVGWELDGRPAGSNNPYVLTVRNDHRLTALFAKAPVPPVVTHRVTTTAVPASGGTVSLNPAKSTYTKNERATATATPSPGYDFTGWQLDGRPAGRDTPYTLTIHSDHRLTAQFTKRSAPPVVTHRVTATAVPASAGAVSLHPAKARYTRGERVTASVSPKPGYDFAGWKLDGRPAGRSRSLSLTVTRDHRLTASFARHKTVRTYKGRVIARTGLLVRDRPDQGGRVIGKLPTGKIVGITCKVKGQTVDGNPRWYRLTDGTYAWSSARYITNIGTAPHWC